jgi:hypothetical protein
VELIFLFSKVTGLAPFSLKKNSGNRALTASRSVGKVALGLAGAPKCIYVFYFACMVLPLWNI